MAEPIERGCCADCGHPLRLSDPKLTGFCQCGALAPRPGEPLRVRDLRRRHTPEEAARRKKHGDAR